MINRGPSLLPKLIYINGPKGCGKTTLADLLTTTNPNGICQVQFPMPLWEIADGMLHLMGRLSDTDPPLDFASPDVKAAMINPNDMPGGPRWRDFLVDQANLLRKYFGPQVLGIIAARSTSIYEMQGMDTIIFPNIRTHDDLIPLLPLAPRRDQVLIRLEREGATFEGDNGSYISPEGILSITLSNNGTTTELLTAALNFLEDTPDADP